MAPGSLPAASCQKQGSQTRPATALGLAGLLSKALIVVHDTSPTGSLRIPFSQSTPRLLFFDRQPAYSSITPLSASTLPTSHPPLPWRFLPPIVFCSTKHSVAHPSVSTALPPKQDTRVIAWLALTSSHTVLFFLLSKHLFHPTTLR